jgi:hypothetical protein
MIIWTGIFENKVSYRPLGSNSLNAIPKLDHIDDELSHNEDTTTEDGTTPCMG